MSKALIILINNAMEARKTAFRHELAGIELLKGACNEIALELTGRFIRRPGIVSIKVEPTSIFPSYPDEEVGVRVTITRPDVDGTYYETALAAIREMDEVFANYQMTNFSTDNSDGSAITEIVYR